MQEQRGKEYADYNESCGFVVDFLFSDYSRDLLKNVKTRKKIYIFFFICYFFFFFVFYFLSFNFFFFLNWAFLKEEIKLIK